MTFRCKSFVIILLIPDFDENIRVLTSFLRIAIKLGELDLDFLARYVDNVACLKKQTLSLVVCTFLKVLMTGQLQNLRTWTLS